MWHEARRQEKLLRTMMVDYRRRAERRRDYYEKTKGDPAQFLQIHGRPCKIHLDPAVATAADSPATMMPWPGDQSVIIDRFDVRAHLDYIAPRRKDDSDSDSAQSGSSLDSEGDDFEDRCAKYECYRILVQNEFLGVSEEKFLHQIAVEEQFGPVQKLGEEEKKKQLAPKKAAIAFSYEDSSTSIPAASSVNVVPPEATEEDESDSDVDLDLSIKVDKLSTDQMRELNSSAQKFGLGRQDFMNLLTRDLDQQEAMRVQKEEEQERALYSGRKRRKERRAFRQRKLQALLQSRTLSPPSYASRPSPTYDEYRKSQSPSKSRSGSPNEGERITFITSFGGDDSGEEKRKTAAAKKHKRPAGTQRRSRSPSPVRSRKRSRERSRSRRSSSRTRTRRRSPSSRSRRRRSRSRSRSRSRRAVRRSRTRSRSRTRRSSSRSRRPRRSRSRTPPVRRQSSSSSSSSSAGPSRTVDSAPVQTEVAPVPAPPIRRYYGRRKNEEDSSSPSSDEVDKDGKTSQTSKSIPVASSTSSANSTATKGKLTPQERLKRKMQAALNKQYKADKRAEKEKLMKQEQERQNREEELRELSLRLRRKDRERRHGYRDSSASSRSVSRSRSRSRSHSSS